MELELLFVAGAGAGIFVLFMPPPNVKPFCAAAAAGDLCVRRQQKIQDGASGGAGAGAGAGIFALFMPPPNVKPFSAAGAGAGAGAGIFALFNPCVNPL